MKEIIKNHSHYLLIFFSFSLPLWQKFTTILLVFWFLVSLLKIKNFKFNHQFTPLLVMYFVYCFFEFLHPPISLKVLEMKASFIALPLIFLLNQYNDQDIKKSLLYFAYGCFTAGILCYLLALFNSISFVDGTFTFNVSASLKSKQNFLSSSIYGGHNFFGEYFSVFHQTVYFALFLNIALCILLFTNILKNKYKYFLACFYCLLIFQISNKTNIIILIIILSFFFMTIIKNRNIKLLYLSVGLSLITLIAVLNPRINNMINNIFSSGLELNREAEDSLGTRLLVWDASIVLAKSNIISGVGVSNAYEALRTVYKKKRYIAPYKYRLNSHNQFLQISIEAGILGLLALFVILIIFKKQKTSYRNLLNLIVLIFIINFCFEAMFSRYSGLICFAFFYTLFASGLNQKALE